MDKDWNQYYFDFILYLEKYHKFINIIELSENENINMDIVNKYIDIKWYWAKLATRSDFTIEFIINHKKDNINIWANCIPQNPNITMEIIHNNIDKMNNYFLLTNKNISDEIFFNKLPKDIIKYNNKKSNWIRYDILNWDNISFNRYISLDFINKNLDKPLNWIRLSYNPNITLEFIEYHIDKEWYWNVLSDNPHININFVKKYINKSWNWISLSKHSNIFFEDIINNNFPWDWNWVSINPNITMDIINNNLHLPWVWEYIACNINIDINMINKIKNIQNINLQLSLNNKIIDKDIINKFPEIEWDWYCLSKNPNFTFIDIIKNIKKIHYYDNIFKNNFTKQKKLFYNYKYIIFIFCHILPDELYDYIYNFY
jgi:hypothetical protein